jgi:hypothetical protein
MKFLKALLLLELTAIAAGAGGSRPLRKHHLVEGTRERVLQDSVVQVDEYDCKTNSVDFGTGVFIDMKTDVSKLSDETIEEMGESFMQTYAEVNFALCDTPYFRTLSGVEIARLFDKHHMAQQSNASKTMLKVDLTAQCRGCTDFNIFSGRGKMNKNSGNLALLRPSDATAETKQMEGPDDLPDDMSQSCVCPTGITPDGRAPTETEFHEIFDMAVKSIDETSDYGDFDLFEVEEYECAVNTTRFSSTVFIRIDGDLGTMSTNETSAMEEAFMTAYNSLNFEFCDYPHFRTITSVSLDQSFLNRRLEDNEGAIDLDFDGTVLLVNPPFDANVLKFRIKGDCRNCTATTPIFSLDSDATSSSPLSIPEVMTGRTNDLQGHTGECYCPAHPVNLLRAPTKGEFKEAFNITMMGLQDDGMLDEVTMLRDVLEVTEVNCSSKKTRFHSAIYVELDIELETLTSDEKAAIEESFLESYNALTFSTCDAFFRELLEVQIVPSQIRRRDLLSSRRSLQESNTTGMTSNETNATESNTIGMTSNETNVTDAPLSESEIQVMEERFPAVFSVRGTCRNCPVSENGNYQLFDDVLSDMMNRMLSAKKEPTSYESGSAIAPLSHARHLARNSRPKVCSCPSDVSPTDDDAPTDDAFILLLNARLQELQAVGVVMNFGLVEDLVEATDLCSGESFKPETALYAISFSSDVDTVEDDTLAEAFRLAFNSQRQDDCDALIAEVSIWGRNVESSSNVVFDVKSLQTEPGDLFLESDVLDRFIAVFNAILESQYLTKQESGGTAESVSAFVPPTEMPSSSPSAAPSSPPSIAPSMPPSIAPSTAPSIAPSTSPSMAPSRSPSSAPSSAPSASPSHSPTSMPTLDQAMCKKKSTTITDSVIIDFKVARVGDIDLNVPWDTHDFWPLQDPATLIAAQEYILAFNKLQGTLFCDPFKRKLQHVECVSTETQILSGTLCCTVQFTCYGNCKDFIYPDRDPIGAFYDESGYEYPTDDSCSCSRDGPKRAPSVTEHFNMINDMVPYELLSFDFRGFSTKKCPN